MMFGFLVWKLLFSLVLEIPVNPNNEEARKNIITHFIIMMAN